MGADEAMTSKEDKLLKTVEVAEWLNVSPNKVLQLLQQNALKGTRMGTKTIRIYESSVRALIDGGTINAS
jgi:excisionase family DNA binding protein